MAKATKTTQLVPVTTHQSVTTVTLELSLDEAKRLEKVLGSRNSTLEAIPTADIYGVLATAVFGK